jgi:hypothetical protein
MPVASLKGGSFRQLNIAALLDSLFLPKTTQNYYESGVVYSESLKEEISIAGCPTLSLLPYTRL